MIASTTGGTRNVPSFVVRIADDRRNTDAAARGRSRQAIRRCAQRRSENTMATKPKPRRQMVTMWEVVVTGDTPFPIDMLRFDQCIPRTKNDSDTILASHRGAITRPSNPVIRLRHVDYGDRPTFDHARWAELGWSVLEVTPCL